MTRSNRFKVQAFFREFQWLGEVLEYYGPQTSGWEIMFTGEIEDVYVKRIDKDFLARVPLCEGATGSLVDIWDTERIFLISEDGEVLGEPRQDRVVTHNEAYRDDEREDGESVGEAISRLNNPDSVVYAVCVHTGYRIRNHRSVGGFSVTVYKPPRGFTLKGWVEEQQRRAEQMLSAQVAEIDTTA